MRVVKFNCIKCGNHLEAPEGSVRVLCGVCGTTNSPGGAITRLKGLVEKNTMSSGTPYNKSFPAGSAERGKYGDINNRQNQDEATSIMEQILKGGDDQDQKTVNKPGLPVALLFILMPVLIMITEMFQLPPFIIFAVIAVVFVLIIAARKNR